MPDRPVGMSSYDITVGLTVGLAAGLAAGLTVDRNVYRHGRDSAWPMSALHCPSTIGRPAAQTPVCHVAADIGRAGHPDLPTGMLHAHAPTRIPAVHWLVIRRA